jgi:signal transduction histidine kinase
MLQRINHSLDLHKMERGTYVLKQRTVDVLGILEEIKAETAPLIREKAISLGIEVLGEKRDECPALAEEDLFRSMLSNLLLNALQASPEGGTVTVTLGRGPDLAVTIRNQGEVPVPLREIFFEKYATTDHGVGTGLGTYSARLIARTHGGDIELDTTEPGHTTVRLTLPQ